MTAATENLAKVYASIDALVAFAERNLGLDERDADWTRNNIFALFGLDSYSPAPSDGTLPLSGESASSAPSDEGAGSEADWGRDNASAEAAFAYPDTLIADFRAAAVAAGLFEPEEGPVYADIIMGLLSGTPSSIEDSFEEEEETDGGMEAMHWFYRYCVANNYVKKAVLDKNPRFDSHGLVVTINLAKPEFKNMKKAAAGNSVAGGYPKCTICHENEGFAGRNKRTLRTIPVTLGGEQWFWQFSPYGYFHQHGICVNMEHTPMHVDRDTFGHLLDFVDRFPGYFLGCNAALPRIGGSVLAHDHYQGGGELLPMHKAATWASFTVPEYPDATVEILDWPGTAVRVVSKNRDSIVEVSDKIRLAWQQFDDAASNIASHDADGNRQSAVSPSAIITDRGYEMNLIFRNNAVSEEYPEGIFHAHPEFWPIKQEPVGLIEAQGLFILPGRLVDQLGVIEDALAAGEPLPESVSEFSLEWDELTAALNGNRDRDAIHKAVQDELGSVCERILGNTAVFKTKEQTRTFLADLGFNEA
ncbi:putative UTP--hexose-1-phosphate uridylyltransferase [Bifidobacterium saguini DSM 23967]|uniref:Galactose-1-phosphate uridylyltransferase n=2 Tax=Bifidobacterium saguini TaxID=762210 RepID=A0A087DBB7_9BIFI|nr:UDP-glucose--hexose-1-phosphate uridylyltransferase [Bifidobacterium saguini]KFI92817.1 putative UTP--hexose-1-phosphate uridylyltransferase [Bifidobacterium saguini DSM 23967]QTB91814.1 UDP-glucose--hexose-1-phosphate uridylyltransferase [Bifidobacterium saguini]